jgi:uncharacterized protein YjiK
MPTTIERRLLTERSSLRLIRVFAMRLLRFFFATLFLSPTHGVVTSDGNGTHLTEPGVPMFGLDHDGVVQVLRNGAFSCSGSLIEGGYHILTAGHCVSAETIQSMSVRFLLEDRTIEIPAVSWRAHPDYPDIQGLDLGIITLAERAPIQLPRYQPLRALGREINTPNVLFGYGVTGYGETGKEAGSGGSKRGGRNRYEATSATQNVTLATINGSDDERWIFSDFDSGLPVNDGFGFHFQKEDLGFGNDEAYASSGDSGGPIFIENRFDFAIAGVVSGGARHNANPNSDVDDTVNGTWGQFSRDTRISSPESIAFIDAHTMSVLEACPVTFRHNESSVSLEIQCEAGDVVYVRHSSDLDNWETYKTIRPETANVEVSITEGISSEFEDRGFFVALKETGEPFVSLPDPGSLFGIESSSNSALLAVSSVNGFGQSRHDLDLSNLDGLAFDPLKKQLYSFDSETEKLFAMDANSGVIEYLNELDLTGYTISGLAFNPESRRLFAIGKNPSSQEILLGIDVDQGAMSPIGFPGIEVTGLAFYTGAASLFATSSESDSLYLVNTQTGQLTIVGPLGVDIGQSGLTYEAKTDGLYLSDAASGLLYAVDRSGGTASALGPTGYSNVTALAANNSISDQPLYSTTTNDRLGKLFPILTTGELIGPLSLSSLNGLALDANTGTLYGIDIATDTLVRIDRETGSLEEVGPLEVNFPGVAGLAFDPVSKILYATSNGEAANLYKVDTLTGAAIQVGPLGINMPGLAYVPTEETLYGVSGQDDTLYQIDPATGEATSIGPLGINVSYNGLAYSVYHDTLFLVSSSATERLYSIDRTSGTATQILQSEFARANGLAADNLNP